MTSREIIESLKSFDPTNRDSLLALLQTTGHYIEQSLEELVAQKARADSNFASLERIRAKLSLCANEAKEFRRALVNIQAYISDNSGADWDNVRSICREALKDRDQPGASEN